MFEPFGLLARRGTAQTTAAVTHDRHLTQREGLCCLHNALTRRAWTLGLAVPPIAGAPDPKPPKEATVYCINTTSGNVECRNAEEEGRVLLMCCTVCLAGFECCHHTAVFLLYSYCVRVQTILGHTMKKTVVTGRRVVDGVAREIEDPRLPGLMRRTVACE